MVIRETIDLPPEPASTPTARHFVANALVDGDLDERLREVALLLTSEVVTNAVIHARTEIRVSVDVRPSALRIEVSDGYPEMPPAVRQSRDSSGGRGLLMVERLASSWGVDVSSTGKTIWFEMVDTERRKPRRPSKTKL
jgi:anti-sigma regulatory factor (Ser/Thr protein kinase)